VCSPEGEPIREELVKRRIAGEKRLRHRLEKAQASGDLNARTDPAILAKTVITMAQGIAVQAAAGSTRKDLQKIVASFLTTWPG
jgi:hypothetical protein